MAMRITGHLGAGQELALHSSGYSWSTRLLLVTGRAVTGPRGGHCGNIQSGRDLWEGCWSRHRIARMEALVAAAVAAGLAEEIAEGAGIRAIHPMHFEITISGRNGLPPVVVSSAV